MSQDASRNRILRELQSKGVDDEVCSFVMDTMGGSGWRETMGGGGSSYAQALAALHLSGYPHLADRPVQYAIQTASLTAAAANTLQIVLSPRIPVLVVATVFEQPISAATLDDITTVNQTHAGNPMYPDGGENAVSIVRLKDPSAFTNEALRSNANAFPEPLLVSNALSINWGVTNNHATVAAILKGTFFAITLKEDHKDFAGLKTYYTPRGR